MSINIINNVSAVWQTAFDDALVDWDNSSVISPVAKQGNGKTQPCKAVAGDVNVCSDAYGYTGWLGIAQIWASGDHITQAVVKLNDSYFNSTTYNKSYWRALVTCQEIGHAFGLGHQDENFDNPNLGTCMDYTSNPLGPPNNEHPNAHDYDLLDTMYAHTDGGSGGGGSPGKGRNKGVLGDDDIGNLRSGWGREIGFTADGRADLYERQLGDGSRVITHVFWIPDAERGHRSE
ncbi:MAG: hypothetical protein EP340_10705 [Alphaproteobacteria bacterium]|nr:MAG: hypothetical protein EP340_10705 [Alphaproteobacteria bacterium]